MARLEVFRADTVDALSFYVAISRGGIGAAVHTDSRAFLTEVLGIRDGAQVGVIDNAVIVPGVATIATPRSSRTRGW